jgi:hypothetical protein
MTVTAMSTTSTVRSGRLFFTRAQKPSALLVLLDDPRVARSDQGLTRAVFTRQLNQAGLSVLRVAPEENATTESIVSAIDTALEKAALRTRDRDLPLLIGGIGACGPVAAKAALKFNAAGIFTIDGSLLSMAWSLHTTGLTTLVLESPSASFTVKTKNTLSNALLSNHQEIHTPVYSPESIRALRRFRSAALGDGWPKEYKSRALRFAAPAAIGMLGVGAAPLLTALPVAATQRSGDGVAAIRTHHHAAATVNGAQTKSTKPLTAAQEARRAKRLLEGKHVGSAKRSGDSRQRAADVKGAPVSGLTSNSTHYGQSGVFGIDGANHPWEMAGNVDGSSFSTSSSSSSTTIYTPGAAGAILLAGRTVSSQSLYNGIRGTASSSTFGAGDQQLSITNNATALGYGGQKYIGTPGTKVSINGQNATYGTQTIDGVDIARQNYLSNVSGDAWERTFETFTNSGSSPVTINVNIWGLMNIGYASTSTVTSSSNSFILASSTNPSEYYRYGYVVQGPNAPVALNPLIQILQGPQWHQWSYHLTIPAGATQAIVNYEAVGTTDLTVQDQLNNIQDSSSGSLTSDALTGLTSTQLSEIQNFVVAPAPAPATPTDVTVVAGNAQATVSWANPATNGVDAVNNEVQYSTNGTDWTTASSTISPTATSYVVTGLTNGTPYQFRVLALSASGATSAPAVNSSTVTPTAPSTTPVVQTASVTSLAATGMNGSGMVEAEVGLLSLAGLAMWFKQKRSRNAKASQ